MVLTQVVLEAGEKLALCELVSDGEVFSFGRALVGSRDKEIDPSDKRVLVVEEVN